MIDFYSDGWLVFNKSVDIHCLPCFWICWGYLILLLIVCRIAIHNSLSWWETGIGCSIFFKVICMCRFCWWSNSRIINTIRNFLCILDIAWNNRDDCVWMLSKITVVSGDFLIIWSTIFHWPSICWSKINLLVATSPEGKRINTWPWFKYLMAWSKLW